jgi:hypothetical protein
VIMSTSSLRYVTKNKCGTYCAFVCQQNVIWTPFHKRL